ncbi:hypothetical protein D9613_001526 [Agrocybe pediades]|uniref:Fungal-type protein kinase domain-containing protein n=1 Tax=Agrocybe pediades TaxID=84607 RepID=A0A8H4R7X5_9AGAR|nr:hypothetical protein D9613_001526 [Agrocybe pediades]
MAQPPCHHHPKDTPNTFRSSAGSESPTQQHPDIADEMADEFIVCHFDKFIDTYLPFNPDDQLITQCVEKMKTPNEEGECIITEFLNDEGANELRLNAFPDPPRKTPEPALFTALTEFSMAIEHLTIPGRSLRFKFYNCPDDVVASDLEGGGNKIDCCFVKEHVYPHLPRNNPASTEKYKLHNTHIAVPGEWNENHTSEDEDDNNRQLVSAAVRIMNDDARRLFTLGLTLVGEEMRLWYFGRSHSAVSSEVDFIKDPKLLIKVFIAFMFATDEELGYDPTVTRHSKNCYTYFFPAVPSCPAPADNARPAPIADIAARSQDASEPNSNAPKGRYFRTIDIISEYRSGTVTGRMPRIWLVQEVKTSEPGAEEAAPGHFVLKDVWLAAFAPTEKQIQNDIFADIESFAKNPLPDNKRQFEKFKKAHADLFEGGAYKKYFLTIEEDYRGASTKALPGKFARHHSLLHLDPSTTKQGSVGDKSSSKQAFDTPEVLRPSYPPFKDRPAQSHGITEREFASRRQYRVVFKERCRTVESLRTLGEVFEVLRQVLIPIRLMFAAGWVHRDISTGNILAYQPHQAEGWTAKLSDLEYAKKFPPDDNAVAAIDPKTGTPYFMPIEIASSTYLYDVPVSVSSPPRKDSPMALQDDESLDESDDDDSVLETFPNNDIEMHVIHNFQHELESLWWIILYELTARIMHLSSNNYAKTIFQNTVMPTTARTHALRYSIDTKLKQTLPEFAKLFIDPVEQLRRALLQEYKKREQNARVYKPESYISIHRTFKTYLNHLCELVSQCPTIELGKPQQVITGRNLVAGQASKKEGEINRSSAEIPPTSIPAPTTPPRTMTPTEMLAPFPSPARIGSRAKSASLWVAREGVEGADPSTMEEGGLAASSAESRLPSTPSPTAPPLTARPATSISSPVPSSAKIKAKRRASAVDLDLEEEGEGRVLKKQRQ